MTSRERVRAVLEHRIPDRIPNGLGGCETEGLHVVAYDKLQHLLGLERVPTRIDTFMTNAVFEIPVIKAMEGDIVLLASPNMCKSNIRGDITGKWKNQELWGKTYSIPVNDYFHENPDGSTVWDSCGGVICPKGHYVFDADRTTDLFTEFDYPDPDDFNPNPDFPEEKLRALEEAAKELYNSTDLSICLGETITDLQFSPGGMIGGMVLMKEEPDIMHAYLEKCTEAGLKQIEQLEQAVGKYVDILSIAHDFGDNRGVTIGDDLWREIYKPHYKALFQGWQKRTNMKVNLHSCGSIANIIPDLIDCGLQVLNPVQTSANGMSAVELKEKFGNDIVFWGGAYDAQLISEDKSYEEVYEAVKKNCQIFGKNGQFIFSGVHNLPATIPEEHLRAMLDGWKAVRNY